MRKEKISFKNIQLQYSVNGQGPVVILVHGFAESGQIWDEFVEPLSLGYQLIIPEIPGSGGSEPLPGNDISIEDYADCIHAILIKENITECILAGHSMGGYISFAFAKNYPGFLRGIALIHSSAYADDDAKKETRQKAIEFISRNDSETFLKTAVPDLFADKNKSKDSIEKVITMGKNIAPPVLIQYYKAMMNRPPSVAVLETFTKPVLFILGEHDKAVPLQYGLEQSYIAADTHVYILRKSAHMGMIEEKEKTLRIFTHFLQGIFV